MNRVAHGYANPDDGRGIDPVAYKSGTFLCTIPQLITLIQLIDGHARTCTGKISWRSRDCTFIGAGMAAKGARGAVQRDAGAD